MKKVYFILLLALAAVSCHQPEYVAPTANRQGLTSLSAIITDGIYGIGTPYCDGPGGRSF